MMGGGVNVFSIYASRTNLKDKLLILFYVALE